MAAPPCRFFCDARRIGWLELADPLSPNVLTAGMRQALAEALDRAFQAQAEAPLARLIVVSGRPGAFSAGADLKALRAIRAAADAEALSEAGQALFARVAAFPAPTVAAIQGVCAGGGFELALACRQRVAAADTGTRIGLTEVSLGLIPGWGGCVRLTRLLGAEAALAHIARGRLLPPREAQAQGLVDRTCAPEALRECAAALGPAEAAAPPPASGDAARPPLSLGMPAPGGEARQAAAEVIAFAATAGLDAALRRERMTFGRLVPTPECQNRLRAFFLRSAAKQRTLAGWFGAAPPSAGAAPPFTRIGVVGAGVMGAGIARFLAERGHAVILQDALPPALARAPAGIATTADLEDLRGCDLIIEAITEKLSAKQELFAALGRIARPDAVLASNTSALPVEAIAERTARPERALGLHFFNPVARMELVELVLGERTAPEPAERALRWLKELGKAPVVCRSSPGLLVTRILFFYLNAALRLHEEGAGVAAIDGAMRAFGWPMGPMRLLDEVGLDVAAAILEELAGFFPTRLIPSRLCSEQAARGRLGRKGGSGSGFYRYSESGGEAVNEPAVGGGTAVEPSALAGRLMAVMAEEAGNCLAEGVVKAAEDIDFALISGAGYPAFRPSVLTLCYPSLPRSPRP